MNEQNSDSLSTQIPPSTVSPPEKPSTTEKTKQDLFKKWFSKKRVKAVIVSPVPPATSETPHSSPEVPPTEKKMSFF